MAVTGLANLAVKVADSRGRLRLVRGGRGDGDRARASGRTAAGPTCSSGALALTLFTQAIYEDACALPDEGFLHPALFVDDLDAELARHEVLWGPRTVSGAFGTRRIAFVEAPGGIRLEFMEQIEDAAGLTRLLATRRPDPRARMAPCENPARRIPTPPGGSVMTDHGWTIGDDTRRPPAHRSTATPRTAPRSTRTRTTT